MVEQTTDEKTRERHFWLQPENVTHKLVKTPIGGAVKRNGIGSHFTAVGQLERKLEAFGKAIPVAINDEAARGTTFLFLPVLAGAGAIIYFNASVEAQLSAIFSGLPFSRGVIFWRRTGHL